MLRVVKVCGDYIVSKVHGILDVSFEGKHWFVWLEERKNLLSYFARLLSLGDKQRIVVDDDTVKVLKLSDSYEGLIEVLELSSVHRFVMHNGVVIELLNPQLGIYTYGIRNLEEDFVIWRDLAERLRFLAVIDGERCSGSVKAMFSKLERSYGVDPLEAVLIVFENLSEGIFEDLASYILSRKGYIVFHQAALSNLCGVQPGVPDLEIVKGLTDRGLLPWEYGLLVKRGIDVGIHTSGDIEVIVGEVKGTASSFGDCVNQLLGYLDSGVYDRGICIVPKAIDRIDHAKELGIGLLTWDNEGTPYFLQPEKHWSTSESSRQVKITALNIVLAHYRLVHSSLR